jgi:hypothetical protein
MKMIKTYSREKWHQQQQQIPDDDVGEMKLGSALMHFNNKFSHSRNFFLSVTTAAACMCCVHFTIITLSCNNTAPREYN